jgi:hypothetical protein
MAKRDVSEWNIPGSVYLVDLPRIFFEFKATYETAPPRDV